METTLENPVLKELDDNAFIEAAQQADRGQDIQLPSAEQSVTRADDGAAENKSANPDITLEKDDRPRDALGRFTKTELGEDIPEAERKPAEPPKEETPQAQAADKSDEQAKPDETEYQRAERKRRERERREATWESLEQKRQEITRQQQEFQQQQQEWQRQQAEQAQQRTQGKQPQYTSAEYADFAKQATARARELRAAGDYEEADKQVELAAKATEAALKAQEVEATTYAEQTENHFRGLWAQNMEQVLATRPEFKDPQSPLAKEVGVLLAPENGYAEVFERIPNGFKYATEIAELRLKAGAASGLEAENKELKQRLEKLEQRTALGRGGASPQVSAKSFDQMSDDEQERALLATASAIDRGF